MKNLNPLQRLDRRQFINRFVVTGLAAVALLVGVNGWLWSLPNAPPPTIGAKEQVVAQNCDDTGTNLRRGQQLQPGDCAMLDERADAAEAAEDEADANLGDRRVVATEHIRVIPLTRAVTRVAGP